MVRFSRLWLIFLLAVLGLAALGGWRLLHTQEDLRRVEALQSLHSVAELKIADIRTWRDDLVTDSRLLTENPTMRASLAVLLYDAMSPVRRDAALAAMRARMDLMRRVYDYADVRLIDPNDRVLISLTRAENVAECPYLVPLLARTRASGRAEIGDLRLRDGVPMLEVALPFLADVPGQAQETPGYLLVLEIDPDDYLFPLLQRWPTPSVTAETLLVRRDGDDVLFLNELRHRKGTALRFRIPMSDEDLPAAMGLRGITGTVEGQDYRGVPVLAELSPVPGTDWVMVSKIDDEEAFAAQRRENLLGSLGLLTLMAAMVLLAVMIWRESTAAQERRVLEAKAQLHDREAKLASIFSAASVGIGITRDRRIYEVSRGFCELTGYTKEELLGQSSRIVYPSDDDYVRIGKVTFDRLAKDGVADVEADWRRKDGRIISVILTAALVTPGDITGDVTFTVADITARKRQERDLKRHSLDLERSNRELATFAYVASHDLRSPLRGISQLAEWIVEDLGETPSPEIANYLRLLKSRIGRMEALLDDLLAYSRVGRIEGDIAEVDVAELCRDVFDLNNPPPDFKLHVEGDLPRFATLGTPLTLVFRNLISNAIKHHNRRDGVITITSVDDGEAYVFSVGDDGPGIPPEYHERVFGLFQTLKPRDEVEGSGMGLALVKKIVEIYDGWVRLESDGKSGATFRFRWPKPAKLQEILNGRKAS